MNKDQAISRFIYSRDHIPPQKKLSPQEQRYYDLHRAGVADREVAKIFGVTSNAVYNLKVDIRTKGYSV